MTTTAHSSAACRMAFVANELVMQWAVLGLGAPYDGMVLADVQSRFGWMKSRPYVKDEGARLGL